MQKETKFKEGDRVWTFDVDGEKVWGTLIRNENKTISEWAVNYDDGECCAVLDITQIFKI